MSHAICLPQHLHSVTCFTLPTTCDLHSAQPHTRVMFGEDECERPRLRSPWEALRLASSTSITPTLSTTHSSSSVCSRDSFSLPVADSDWGMIMRHEAVKWNLGLHDALVPESDDYGHIEYKLKLATPSPTRFQRLTTQLKWRLLEGSGIALYELGVLDDGSLVGLFEFDMIKSLETLSKMANELSATITITKVMTIPHTGPVSNQEHDQDDEASIRSRYNLPPTKLLPLGRRRKKSVTKVRKKKPGRDPSEPAPGNGKTRIQPGDSAVSSSSSCSVSSSSSCESDGGDRRQRRSTSLPCSITSSCKSKDPSAVFSIQDLDLALNSYSNSHCHIHTATHSSKSQARDKDIPTTSITLPPQSSAIHVDNTTISAPESQNHQPPIQAADTSHQCNTTSTTTNTPLPLTISHQDLRNRYVVEVKIIRSDESGSTPFLDFEGFGIA